MAPYYHKQCVMLEKHRNTYVCRQHMIKPKTYFSPENLVDETVHVFGVKCVFQRGHLVDTTAQSPDVRLQGGGESKKKTVMANVLLQQITHKLSERSFKIHQILYIHSCVKTNHICAF